ncbi:sigma 54-interacting transcriptional regulator [Roseateles sp. SL47]|uniref:sigma 54-interacting transcriptional regulator n=1 Tax=Roseateles sp. SL47 TaxID=2995138 RepID=UPI00226DFE28|nr:sigma 54-interacting transcriptional regulator [Roseateles sp. SL47]WAC74762.1 sigma 54-interacting transcriptional regulator [Roseateles sp. SL47]
MNEMPRDVKARQPLATPAGDLTAQPLMDRLACLQAELDETRRQLALAQQWHRRPEHRIIDFVGGSPAAQEVKRQARRVAQADAPVLLMGEPGSGKALLAQAIHAASRRAARPLLTLDISAVPRALLEAELFGTAHGVIAPDGEPVAGRLGLADGGTLFLEEIGDLPMGLQAKLLHVLQSQEVPPLGGGAARPVDVRLMASTSRDLAGMVQRGQFRADLYYGLHVLPIRVPALRDRIEDIEAVAEVLLEDLSRRGGLPPKSLGASALAALQRRRWPGNVRELRDVLEQAFLAGSNPVLTASDLAPLLATAWSETSARGSAQPQVQAQVQPHGHPAAGTSPGAGHAGALTSAEPGGQLLSRAPHRDSALRPDGWPTGLAAGFSAALPGAEARPEGADEPLPLPTLSARKAQLEREAIANALRRTKGNRVAAARLLAISRATLYEKLARWPELGRRTE